MIRYCIATGTPVKAEQVNGKWSVEGIAADDYLEQMQLREEVSKPLNTTFYLTINATECLERLKSNLSDTTTVLMPIESTSVDFYVPKPLLAGKLQFVSGYNVSESLQELKDSATVLSNADLLKPQVYYWASFLMASFVALIVMKVALFYKSQNAKISIVQMIRRQVSRMFYYNSERFKWITLLYSLLCFIMITSFLCLYKTSHIIIEKPFYPKSYQESLDHPSSLAFYYDLTTVVSSNFKSAPPESIKGKLWAKLVATGRQNDYSGANTTAETLPSILIKGSEEMTVRRGICLASPLIIALIKSVACGFSPEGELYVVKKMTDALENEVIYGFTSSRSFHVPWVALKLNALFENGFMVHSYEKQLDQRELVASIAGTSQSHRWKQNVVCDDDEDAFTPEPTVKAISLSYFTSFFRAITVVWLTALILHIFQILHAEK